MNAALHALRLTLVVTALAAASGAAAREPEAATSQADSGPPTPAGPTLLAIWGALAALAGGVAYAVPARTRSRNSLRRLESELTERALTLQEEDRRRIARELHDGAGQALTAARLHAAALRAQLEDPRPIEIVLEQLDVALAEIRRSTAALSPPALAELGLARALRRHCDTFAVAAHLDVDCELPAALPPLGATTEVACYRIVQEALANAARHARARRAWVRLDAGEDALELEIGDDGIGLAEDAPGGFGLGSLQQRAHLAGGSLTRVGGPGPGVRIRASLPRLRGDA